MYKYVDTGEKIGIQRLTQALNRLGDLLQKENTQLELKCCGGIVSLMYFQSREMTQDVDAIFPANPKNRQLLIKLIKQVGEEMGLSIDEHSLWFNDSVSFFDLVTDPEVVIFKHSNLVLKAAKWEELLAHKVNAFRHENDVADARCILEEIKKNKGKKKEDIYKAVEKYAPFSPRVPERELRRRFEIVWKIVSNNR